MIKLILVFALQRSWKAPDMIVRHINILWKKQLDNAEKLEEKMNELFRH